MKQAMMMANGHFIGFKISLKRDYPEAYESEFL